MDAMERRREAIVRLVNEKGTISFTGLKEAFPQVSEMTLRTDLKALDGEKKLLRVHGGAKSVQAVIGTDGFLEGRSVLHAAQKEEIAGKAASLVRPDTTVFLDSGSTAAALAGKMPDEPGLIYTTGLNCAVELSRLSRPVVMLPGGRLNRGSQSVFGFQAIHELERVNFDQAFLGVTGFHPSVGFSCGISDEALLKQTAIRRSGKTVVLMDSSKIGIKCSFTFCQLSDVDIIVSDGELPPEFLDACRACGVQVL